MLRMVPALDAADKAASRLVFHLTLPISLEWALSPFFNWHGSPVTAVGLCPWLIAAAAAEVAEGGPILADTGHALWAAGALLCLIAALARWYLLLSRGAPGEMYRRRPRGSLVLWVLFTLFAAGTLDSTYGGRRLPMVSFYLCSFSVMMSFTLVLKATFGRQRPVVALEQELAAVPRALPSLVALTATGWTKQSMPSGDASSAAVFSAVLVLAAGIPASYACFFAVMTSFGRM